MAFECNDDALELLFLEHVASSFDKQMHLMDVIDKRDWAFNMGTGLLSFGTDRFKVQVIGTESCVSQTWKWAWANKESKIPVKLLDSCEILRSYGKKHKVSKFTKASFDLDELSNGHIISTIACGLCKGSAYYRCPYDGGAAFFIIDDISFPMRPPTNVALRVCSIFPQAVLSYPVSDHKKAFVNYLFFYNARVIDENDCVVGVFGEGTTVKATFDEKGRLLNIASSKD